jgi:DNA-binding CsgD family transcriptional regulator
MNTPHRIPLSESEEKEFRRNLLQKCSDISRQEMEVCILIRNRKKDFEIGEILVIAERTVEKHREHIRKKLHLKGDLGAFLDSI